jgi:hypothetical protein
MQAIWETSWLLLIFLCCCVDFCLPEEDQAMPVLHSEGKKAPRSSLRHRPIETDQPAPDPVADRQQRLQPGASTTSRPGVPDGDELDLEEAEKEEEGEEAPPRRSAPGKAKQRASAGKAKQRSPAVPAPDKRRFHPLFFIGIGLMITALLWAAANEVLAWGISALNTLHYGYPRIYQLDAFVDQEDSAQHPSHFVAINLHGVVSICDFPGGDPSRVRVIATISVPGPDADQAVVTLRFVDLDHNKLPDMIIDIAGTQNLLVNDGKTFRQPTSAEQQQLLQYLRQHPNQ